MSNKNEEKYSNKMVARAAGVTTGFGAGLACKGVFNLAAVDPTFTLFTSATVGVAVAFTATKIFSNITKPSVTNEIKAESDKTEDFSP